MSQSKVTEIKNKMMRMQEQMLKDKDIQNKQVMSFNEYAMEVQKKYMQLESKCWYQEWCIRWLERNLLKLNPEDSTTSLIKISAYGLDLIGFPLFLPFSLTYP